MSKVLVVDDEQAICWSFTKLLEGMGHQVCAAATAEHGLQLAEKMAPDLIVLDVRLPGMDGLSAMQEFQKQLGDTPVIVMTAFGDIQTAITAIRNGAFEYLLKPFELKEVRAAIERALKPRSKVVPIVSNDKAEMIGDSLVMQSLYREIALAATSNVNVLLKGESGVGKELAAQAIHNNSNDAEAPFVAVNVAALSPSLAESELFGHVDGAYTGANRTREGLLLRANGGTLFLDEVAEIPLTLQVKLLRVLEQKEVLPVGSDATVPINFRVIAATNQNLWSMVQKNDFRLDLYYRLCAYEITIPSLRDRPDDIPLLASRFAAQINSSPIEFAEETFVELQCRPWNGNVRELRNAIEHAVVVARSGIILPEHLPKSEWNRNGDGACKKSNSEVLSEASRRRAQQLLSDSDAEGKVYNQLLSEVEAPLFKLAMERFQGECAPAARALGLHRTTLRKKLDEL